MTRLEYRDLPSAEALPVTLADAAIRLTSRQGSVCDVRVDGNAAGWVYASTVRGPWRHDNGAQAGRTDTLEHAIRRLGGDPDDVEAP